MNDRPSDVRRFSGRLPACTYRFVVSGLNLERFLNAVSQANIPLQRIRRIHAHALACECFSADLPVLKLLTQDKGWRMDAIRPLGLSAVLEKLKKRPGIPIGAVLGILTALVLSQFIWQVDVHNAGPYQAEVKAYLAENGYRPGIRRHSIDAGALEQALTRRYPRIAWFHVYASGVTLVVDVTQGVPAPQLSAGEAADVVAQHDGIVQSIRVYAGTAMVRAGDAVRAGDVLIRGAERAADETEIPVEARGVVTARCWKTMVVRFPLREVLSTETGRETCFTRLRTPFFTWPDVQESAEYLAWNTYVETWPVGGSFFPVWLERITQREASLEYVPRVEAEVRQEAEKAAFESLKNALFGYEIIDKWVDYCMIEDEILALSATAEWLMDIGGSRLP